MVFQMFPKRKLSVDTSTVGAADIFIVESDTDAAAANAAGFPAIAFPNNFRTDENYTTLFDACMKSKKAIIINGTSDTQRLGEIGLRLTKDGLPVFIVNLTNGTIDGSMSLSLFLQTHTPADFRALTKQARAFIDILIGNLAENFPAALPDIREKLLPMLVRLDSATQKHYIDMIRKRVKTSVKVIDEMLRSLKSQMRAADEAENESSEDEEENDPDILAAAAILAQDPLLIKRRIDIINKIGVSGERKNIAIFFCALDSRLLMEQGGIPGQSAISCKISGHQGSGKSYTLLTSLSIYPACATILITSASERSLYYLEKGIAHKCLILMEAFQFSNDREDSELAYTVRTLLSEGKLVRAVTEKDAETGKFVTRDVVLKGPISFITTTIESNLEVQLDDRLFTVHPDESVEQTKRIISNRAKQKAGSIQKPDDREMRTWKAFHRSLAPVSVVIPYAEKIADFLNQKSQLPIAARRAINKVLNIIQAVACAYQFQRERDAEGNLIATIGDYFMSLQIVAEAFRENMGQLPKATGERLDYLKAQGHMSPKDLANHFGVSRAAISKWSQKLEEDGCIEWVDLAGNSFVNDKAVYAAKKGGKAHIRVSGQANNPWGGLGLPMPQDLISVPDSAWAQGGEQYENCNLHLTSNLLKALNSSSVSVPTAAATSTTPENPVPVLLSTEVTATLVGPAWAHYSPEPETVGFIESNQICSTEDQAYWDGIKFLKEQSGVEQSSVHDVEREEEPILHDDPNYRNPLI